MSRKKKTDGVQDALISDEITPLMLLALTAKASRMKDAAAAFRIAASKMLDLATKDEYIEKYKNIDPITDALYDACDLSQHIFDAANAVNDAQLVLLAEGILVGPRARGEGGYRAQFVGSVA